MIQNRKNWIIKMRNKRINNGENCMEKIQPKAITDASDKKYISVLFLGIKCSTGAEKGNKRGQKRTLRSTAASYKDNTDIKKPKVSPVYYGKSLKLTRKASTEKFVKTVEDIVK